MYSSGHTTAEREVGEGGRGFRIWGTSIQCVGARREARKEGGTESGCRSRGKGMEGINRGRNGGREGEGNDV